MLKVIVFCFFLIVPLLSQAEEAKTGEDLYQAHCSACHSLGPPPKAAPPFRGVIRHYYERHQERDKFIAAIRTFVLEPEKSEIICTPAKDRFGAMPKLPVNGQQVEKIASWMWDNKSLWPPRYR